MGASLAILPPVVCSPLLREAGGIAGLILILASITLMSDQTPLFIASGTACLGTSILIESNRERTIASRFLSLPPFVGIGLISYSLYLWHWPLLAFGRYYVVGEPSALVRLLLLLSAVGLAFFSWFLVEQPLRRPGSRRRAFIISAAIMAALITSGLTLWALRGLPQRLPPDALKLQHIADQKPQFCFGCGAGHRVLWGDSHAAALSRRHSSDHLHERWLSAADRCGPVCRLRPLRTARLQVDRATEECRRNRPCRPLGHVDPNHAPRR